MENVKYMAILFDLLLVYGLTDLLSNFICLLKIDTASFFTLGAFKNIILSCFNFCDTSKRKEEQIVLMNIYKGK